MMKKEIITAVTFLLIILFAFGLILRSAEEVKYSMFTGFKDMLPENYGFFDIIKASIKNTDNRIDIIARKMPLIDWYGAYKRLIGSRVMEDTDSENIVYKLKNGQLTFVYPEQDMRQYVENIAELKEFLSGKNTEMLYIQVPSKVDKYNPQLPIGINDMANVNADSLLQGLSVRGVQYYDLREAIHNSDIRYGDLFFITDHHWTPQAGLWAYSQVSKLLEKHYGFSINQETISSDHFSYTLLENSFLGTLGRRTGKYYADLDDFTLVIPEFKTDYNVKIYKTRDEYTEYNGSFDDTLIRKNRVDPEQPITTNRHSAYLNNDYYKVEIINNQVEDGKILIIHDSYGLTFSSFMSLNFHNTDIIDLRQFREPSVMEYLENHQYDLVLCFYNPSTFHPTMFTFKKQ